MAETAALQNLDERMLISIDAPDETSKWCDPELLLPFGLLLPFPVGFEGRLLPNN